MIYEGRCKKEDTKQLLEVLDEVFFSEDNKTAEHPIHFLELLPKLYKDKYDPAYNNFIIAEDGVIKSAVGLYPFRMKVCGAELKVGGIGNVAVTKDSRKKGYMVKTLNMCLNQMKADGTDVSILGGDRQRYGYFGYEPFGLNYNFSISRRSMSHTKGADYKTPFRAVKLTPADTDDLAKIKALGERNGIYAERPMDSIFDILCSWRNEPYSVYLNDEFKGYFSKEKYGGGVSEVFAVDVNDLQDIFLCALDVTGSDGLDIDAAPYDTQVCDYMAKICRGSDFNHSERVNVLNYRHFIEVMLSAKAARLNLGSGSLVLFIHGCRQDEKIRITVDGKKVTVEDTQDSPDFEFSHLDAMRFIGSIYSRHRDEVPAFAQNWFPLEFFCRGLDNV